jgi:hypothetical protein
MRYMWLLPVARTGVMSTRLPILQHPHLRSRLGAGFWIQMVSTPIEKRVKLPMDSLRACLFYISAVCVVEICLCCKPCRYTSVESTLGLFSCADIRAISFQPSVGAHLSDLMHIRP